ncbi:trichohyalin-like isoform X2 [Dreissena polymorpha]|uniref:trichohyalin-like isoform X2 n=1 Tax=Dreissena polymorpha TaxID=45954 RepID=UPI002264ADC5|nr:trichohyalin-like isoform X2 [Dreissena polymorpha]
MAEGASSDVPKNTLPIRGKVQKVRQEWAVHEDGAFAYHLQSEEIDRHYGLNRFNNRTVRVDIPIAKIVQTDEELRLQNERFQELQALNAQAEEDERIAKQLLEQEQLQNEAHKMAIELTDEEFAKSVQEKEKKRYERYLEKKRLQKLKKEREQIERTQQQRTEEARLHVRQTSGSTDDLEEHMGDLDLHEGQNQRYCCSYRVTPSGKIEDDGDFSDFYKLPDHVDPAHRQVLQELQDEELAKLLQEQEHKRTKAEVDRAKLREIEAQDARLAEIMQEQEKIRLKKAKQKWKEEQEAKRAQEAAQRPPPLPRRPADHDHRRYRRNSFILSMENNGGDGDQQDDLSSPGSSDDFIPADDPRLQPTLGHRLADQASTERHRSGQASERHRSGQASERHGSDQQASERHRSDQASERHRSGQDSERLRSVHASNGQRSDPRRQASGDMSLNHSGGGSREIMQNFQNVQKVKNTNLNNTRNQPDFNPAILPQDKPDVERWLASQPPDALRRRLRSEESDQMFDSPSPPNSLQDDEAFSHNGLSRSHHHNVTADTGSHYAVSDPFNFNIATAIDPTYTRRTSEGVTERKQPVNHSQHRPPVALEDRTIGTGSSHDSYNDDEPGVVSPFVPVQGQRRTGGERSRKPKQPDRGQNSSKDKNNCKQQ